MFIRIDCAVYIAISQIKRLEAFGSIETAVCTIDGNTYYADRPLSTMVDELEAITGILIQGGLQAD